MHDGQIMVRLKKKRFIIIDYSIVPTQHDLNYVKDIPYIVVPEGAGERLCATRNCPRIGVPVQLYDSEPDEPASLYLRGGLCFSCQRNLNEKRRTQRKRKCDQEPQQSHSRQNSMGSQQQQRYRLNGSLLDLNPDAVIINGPIEGTRTRGPDYQYPRIGQDLLHLVAELHRGAHSLLHSAYQAQSSGTLGNPATINAVNSLFQSTFRDLSRATYLITQWKASWDENLGGSMLASQAQQALARQQHPLHAPPAVGMPREEDTWGHHPMHEATTSDREEGMDSLTTGGEGKEEEHEESGDEGEQEEQQLIQQQQQRATSALMAPTAAAASNSSHDLSEFYEEV